jgi:predicted kinase
MPNVIFFVGVSGSGKTTYAQQISNDTTLRISGDDILEEWARDAGISYQDAYIAWSQKSKDEVLSRVEWAIENNANILWDQTNLSWVERETRMNMFPDTYTKIAVAFEMPDDVLKDYASRTEKNVPEAILQAQKEAYERPDYDEGFDKIVIITPKGICEL